MKLRIERLLLIIGISLLIRFYLYQQIPIANFLGNNLSIPWWIILTIGQGNIVLLWIISQRFLNFRYPFLPALLYAISPWTIYHDLSGTLYVALLFWLMMLFVGVLLVKKKIILRYLILIVIGASLFYNLLSQPILIFKDIGLLNAVNSFQGELKQAGVYFWGRFIENRYVYFTQHTILTFLNNLSPVFYFTSQAKLLGFSFTPPLMLGFIIPLLVGLETWIQLGKRFGLFCLIMLTLLIPSVLSGKSPDFNRLLIFSPIIFFTISFGLERLLISLKSRISLYLVIIMILLLIVQSLTVLLDLQLREPLRLQSFL